MLSLVAPFRNWNKLFSQGWAKSIAAQAPIHFFVRFSCPSGISMQSPEHAQAAQDTHGPRTQKGHMRQRKLIRSFRVRLPVKNALPIFHSWTIKCNLPLNVAAKAVSICFSSSPERCFNIGRQIHLMFCSLCPSCEGWAHLFRFFLHFCFLGFAEELQPKILIVSPGSSPKLEQTFFTGIGETDCRAGGDTFSCVAFPSPRGSACRLQSMPA